MNKPLLTLAFLLIFLLPGKAQPVSIYDLRGCWDVLDNQMHGAKLEIIDSANIYLSLGEERKKLLTFSIDFSKSPAWFDFTIENSGRHMHVKSLLAFFNESTIKWQLFVNEERTMRFTAGRGGLMFLRRYKEEPSIAIK